ncbi:NB-ARC domain-containing protein [Coleofasciculus sp.]|uniref:NB-ARC domain-containing protein n=1 Tax=Coleofasciculus sp. TaxID=3100458 RepID=UPI0039F8F33E
MADTILTDHANMNNSLCASTEGLTIVDRARQRRGWTKTSTACWWEDAHTSRATLRRFWRGERIQQDAFIAICQAVGISDWQAIAQLPESLNPNVPALKSPLIDWDEAPDLDNFYGRTQPLNQLEEWITTDNCKLVAIVGMGGIGKTALTVALCDRVQSDFDCLLWRSLTYQPSLLTLLDSILNTLEPTVIQDIHSGIRQLRHHLQQRRCLLVLDGLDSVVYKKDDIEEYSKLLQSLSLNRHQSCILVTSREQLPGFDAIAANSKWVRCLTLQGLEQADAMALLQAGGFTSKEPGLSALWQLYRGNPLALKTIIPLIQSIFAGNVNAFRRQNTIVVGDRLEALLNQQFDRLSESELSIAYWLAIWQEPISLCRLQSHLLYASDLSAVLTGIAALETRSLLEKRFSADEPSFTLQPMMNSQSGLSITPSVSSVSSVPLWYIKSILPQESKRYMKRHQKT